MKGIDLRYLCTTIGNLSGIPIRIFRDNEQIFYYCVVRLPKDPMVLYRDEILQIDDHISSFSTLHFHYYGIVNSENIRIILGPTRQVPDSDQELRELAFRADVAKCPTADRRTEKAADKCTAFRRDTGTGSQPSQHIRLRTDPDGYDPKGRYLFLIPVDCPYTGDTRRCAGAGSAQTAKKYLYCHRYPCLAGGHPRRTFGRRCLFAQ